MGLDPPALEGHRALHGSCSLSTVQEGLGWPKAGIWEQGSGGRRMELVGTQAPRESKEGRRAQGRHWVEGRRTFQVRLTDMFC